MSDEEKDSAPDRLDRDIPDDDGDQLQSEAEGPTSLISFPNCIDEISMAAGLLFPVKGVLRCLELALETRNSWPRKVELATAVGLAAVLEYLCAQVLELAGNAARDNRKQMIIPRHVNIPLSCLQDVFTPFIIRGNYEFVPDKKRPQLVFYPPAMRSIVLKRQTPRPWKLPPSSSEVVDATVLDAFSAHSDTQSIIMTFDKQDGPKRGKPKRVLKTALPERQYTVECDDPVWVDMSRLKFHNPLRAVLRQVHPDTGIGIRAAGADYVNAILHHWLCRLEARAFLAAHKGGECELLTPEHLVTAIGECLSGNLAKHALSEMRKATTKMTESLPEKLTKRALLEMRKATKTQHGFVIHRFRKQYPCGY